MTIKSTFDHQFACCQATMVSSIILLAKFFFLLRWWQVPYYWFGIKMYDLVAGDRNVKSSYYLSKKNTLELFPMLKSDNLCGGIVYYDGM